MSTSSCVFHSHDEQPLYQGSASAGHNVSRPLAGAFKCCVPMLHKVCNGQAAANVKAEAFDGFLRQYLLLFNRLHQSRTQPSQVLIL